MIRFTVTKEEAKTIQAIIERAKREAPGRIDPLSLNMDLCACHANGCLLDFEKLLGFPAFDFWHDITGIGNRLDRTTGKLTQCFLPRSSK